MMALLHSLILTGKIILWQEDYHKQEIAWESGSNARQTNDDTIKHGGLGEGDQGADEM